jgi:hypothetical protein
MRATRSAWLLTAIAIGAAALTALNSRPDYSAVRAGKPDAGYLDSAKCLSCHPDHSASWRRTYHRTMTQEAGPESVQGDFSAHNTLDYLGVHAVMRRSAGRYEMTLNSPDGKSQDYPIDRTVGSRRIQQYLTREARGYVRLPVAWDIVHQRWMSLNGAFFFPDGTDYFQHRAPWDPNCVFCHNVKAQPRYDETENRFDTEVAELGIACGACHGPAAAHAAAAASPLTRALWRLDPHRDRLIVQPEKLSAERSLMVCGHCHGQRLPEPRSRIRQLMVEGDPYNAGGDLAEYYQPVGHETAVSTRTGGLSFATRFWNNGSPRLTAYEYQGILRSACFRKGSEPHRINCLTCHTMHDGGPKGTIQPEGQISDENRLTDKPCLTCHEKFSPVAALSSHTGHGATSSGSRCYNCHMPRVVQGVMAVHRTHDITIPDPALTAGGGVPNACNLCHLDRSVLWAQAAAGRLWPKRFGDAPKISGPGLSEAEGPRMLFAGDAVTRALAAEALGGLPENPPAGSRMPSAAWAQPYLIEAWNDNYPIVRYYVANSLEKAALREKLEKPDYLADDARRGAMIEPWRQWLARDRPADAAAAAAQAAALRRNRHDVDIEVGE